MFASISTYELQLVNHYETVSAHTLNPCEEFILRVKNSSTIRSDIVNWFLSKMSKDEAEEYDVSQILGLLF